MDELPLVALPQVYASTTSCAVHAAHEPSPLYTEEHVLVPEAWQAYWQPHPLNKLSSPFGLIRYDGLFDREHVTVCRTGHGNIHAWIVALMREVPKSDEVAPAVTAVKEKARKLDVAPHKQEFEYAVEALERWKAAGGSLLDLLRAGLRGEF